ncbi:MAG: nitrogen fixation negative regulator NifL [Rhodocyclaceae bacterium]|nr:nitrogen fixation negative regulator NifL [Rhodocyclaceae bacterium]
MPATDAPTPSREQDEPNALPPEVYRQATDQADLAISITDNRANILYANEAFSRVTGYGTGEILGRNESLLSNQTTPRGIYEEMWATLRAGKAWTGRLLNRKKDASLYLAELNISPVQDGAGRTSHYLGMHRDITELHHLECQVRNQKRLIESVVDAAPVVFALMDTQGVVRLDNHEYKKLVTDLGVPEPAHLIMDMACPGWRQKILAQPSACQFVAREARVDQPRGNSRWFSCSCSLIRMHDDSANGFFCGDSMTGLLLAVNDISFLRAEQERARIAALQAMLAEEERIASIRESLSAALFRLEEPMNVMTSAVNLMQRRDPTSARVLNEALAASREYVEGLRQVIPPHGPETHVGVNLNEVLRDVLEICTPRLLAAGVVVDWRPAPTLPHIPARPMQLRVLFKALLENAIEAMNGKGWTRRELTLSTTRAADCIVVRMEDSGPGIPDDVKLHAFEPFFSTKTGSGRHLGTGLARAQQIVSDHGGIIDLEDRNGGGASVVVELRIDGDPL